MNRNRKRGCLIAALLPPIAGWAGTSFGQEPDVEGGILRSLTSLDGDTIAAPLRALAIVTVLGVVPSVVLLTTCFPRILIVLSFLRRALGAQDLPPNMVLFGLALLLTGVVMTPVWREVYEDAYVPLVELKTMTPEDAFRAAEAPLKRFMLAHTLRKDLRLMVELSRGGEQGPARDRPRVAPAPTVPEEARELDDLSIFTILPAYVLSELKLAFQMGFLLFLPFLLIDLVVAAVLVSMGMIMLPPGLVSVPLKVLVFVLADGWSLMVGQVVYGIGGVA